MQKVSVIVPVYKGNCYMPNLVDMLEVNWKNVNQTDSVKVEMVLVNDFPLEELRIDPQWVKNISWRIITNDRNSGIHFSRVQGLIHSEGDFVLFLDQDDEISPVYIKEQLKALNDFDAVICNGKHDSDLIYRNTLAINKAIDIEAYKCGYNQIISPGQVLLRRGAIPEEWVNNILKYNGADDYFLWMLMLSKKRKMATQDKTLYWHVISDNNTSKDTLGMDKSVFEVTEKMKSLELLTPEEEATIRESRIPVEEEGKEQKFKRLLEKWMVLRDRKISVEKFLSKKNINTIVIYGGGIFGKHLYYELKESNIQVECFMDQNMNAGVAGVKTIIPGVDIGSVDAIIVTPIMGYKQIWECLREYYTCDIISIDSVLSNADCELQAE